MYKTEQRDNITQHYFFENTPNKTFYKAAQFLSQHLLTLTPVTYSFLTNDRALGAENDSDWFTAQIDNISIDAMEKMLQQYQESGIFNYITPTDIGYQINKARSKLIIRTPKQEITTNGIFNARKEFGADYHTKIIINLLLKTPLIRGLCFSKEFRDKTIAENNKYLQNIKSKPYCLILEEIVKEK